MSLQIRWYSFQFLMEELSEGLDALLAAVEHLLPLLPGQGLCHSQ